MCAGSELRFLRHSACLCLTNSTCRASHTGNAAATSHVSAPIACTDEWSSVPVQAATDACCCCCAVDINQTRIEKLLKPRGDFIVWTPPFVFEVQPIEMIWGQVKNEVAAQYTLKRTLDMTREQTDDAFNRITPTVIQKRIAHCHRWIHEFLQTEEAGSLRPFGSLQQLIATSSNTPMPSDLGPPTFQEVEAEEEEEIDEP